MVAYATAGTAFLFLRGLWGARGISTVGNALHEIAMCTATDGAIFATAGMVTDEGVWALARYGEDEWLKTV